MAGIYETNTITRDPMQEASANNQIDTRGWLERNADWLMPMGKVAAQIGYNVYANEANNQFNKEEAQKQRNWEEYMSNTAYQRAYADMEKAGLNPHLAGGQGGASTPSGSAAATTGMMPADIAAISNNTAMTHAQIANLEADTAMKNKQSGKTQKETEYIENKTALETALNEVQIELTQAQTKDAKKAAEQKQQIIINQMVQNLYEFTTGQKMPSDARSAIVGSIIMRMEKGKVSNSADTLYQIIKAEIDNYQRGNKK